MLILLLTFCTQCIAEEGSEYMLNAIIIDPGHGGPTAQEYENNGDNT